MTTCAVHTCEQVGTVNVLARGIPMTETWCPGHADRLLTLLTERGAPCQARPAPILGRCGTCKNWGDHTDGTGWAGSPMITPWDWIAEAESAGVPPADADRLAEARALAVEQQHRTCQAPAFYPSMEDREAGPIPLYVTDGSQYTASMHTMSTFGCVLWEQDTRPAAPEPSTP